MLLKEIIQAILRSYCIIVTGSLLCTGVFCSLFWRDTVFGLELVWQVLIAAALAAMMFLVYYSKKELSKRAALARTVIHFFLIEGVLIGCAYWFDWFHPGTLVEPLCFAGLVAVVYLLVHSIMFRQSQKESDAISKAIASYFEK